MDSKEILTWFDVKVLQYLSSGNSDVATFEQIVTKLGIPNITAESVKVAFSGQTELNGVKLDVMSDSVKYSRAPMTLQPRVRGQHPRGW